MEPQTAQMVYTELNTIKQTLQKLEQEIERLTTYVVIEGNLLEAADYQGIVGLGASGTSDISEKHDRYLGEAIADEHLR